MDVGNRGMRHYRSIAIEIQCRRYKLPQLVPMIGKTQICQMDRHQQQREGNKKDQRGSLFVDQKRAIGLLRPAAWGSSVIFPKVASYCVTFCESRFASALACCGLKNTP